VRHAEVLQLAEAWWHAPGAFARDALGIELWERQLEVLRSLRDHRRTAVKSGHNVGKTFVAAAAILWFLFTRPNGRVIATAPTRPGVQDRLWREVTKLHRGARIPLGGEMLDSVLRIDNEGWSAHPLTASSADAFQGVHAEHVLIVFDEAQGIEQEFWVAAESMMGSRGARWLQICNPIYTTGPAHSCFHGQRAKWNCLTISCLEHPNVQAELDSRPLPFPAAVTRWWIEDRAEEWGRESARFRARVLGEFPAEGDDALVPLSYLEAVADLVEIPGVKERHMGVDVARFGSDSNVALLLENRKVERVERWSGLNLMESAGRVRHLAEQWGVAPQNVHVDVVGVGGGVVDRLREANFGVEGVGFGDGATGEWTSAIGDTRCKNRRAELYWALRLLLRKKALIVPRQFSAIWSELTEMRFSYDATDRVVVEPKDAIKARLGRSPDQADALALALSRGGGTVPWVMVF